MRVLVTGGAGFIGSNLVHRLASDGHTVTILDNMSRPGSEANAAWLHEAHAHELKLIRDDVCNSEAVHEAMKDAEAVFHLAGQVAVTSSVNDPRHDFQCNALGTFNVLEAARRADPKPFFLYASTNKVYGGMDECEVESLPDRYALRHLPLGVPETQPLDFHSPYGCSKGAADQYVRDYFRIYGLPTVVARQSCIYGPRQFGVEDQGWLAWFIIAAVQGKPITIYGDGKQVRDVLYVDDLIDFYLTALQKRGQVGGRVYNVGGGPANAIAVWRDFQDILEGILGRRVAVSWSDWRPGDQRVYVSDIRKAQRELGWTPKTGARDGIRRLAEWVMSNAGIFPKCP